MSITRYILPFLLVVISGLMYVLYIDGTYKDILVLRDRKADYVDAIGKAGEVRELQAKLLAEVEMIDQNDRTRLEKLLPSSHDPVLVLYDLNTFAQKHGLALKSPTVTTALEDSKNAGQPTLVPVSIKFSVSAPYSIFRGFMADLEHELALRDVISLRVSADGGEGVGSESSVLTFQIDVEGHAYRTKEKNDPKTPSTP
jgi:hypothetical protein